MRFFLLAGTAMLAAMAVAGAGAHAPDSSQNSTAAQNSAAPADATERLNQEAVARARQQAEERARVDARIREIREHDARVVQENERRQREYDEQMRVRAAAIAAEQARYDAEMARFRAQQEEAQRPTARRGGRAGTSTNNRANAAGAAPVRPAERTRQASASGRTCAQQVQRARGRGRAIGGVVGGVAGIVGGRNLGNVARVGVAALSVPVGALIGEAIASRLDCREQEQAARATEQALEGGVGTTVTWRSETRPGVTGTTTVTAVEPPPGPAIRSMETAPATVPATPATAPVAAAAANVETSPCLTVTDVIIVDGEETRAPKTMCRRPPSNRYMRV